MRLDFATCRSALFDRSLGVEVFDASRAADNADAAPSGDQPIGEGSLGCLARTNDKGIEGNTSLLIVNCDMQPRSVDLPVGHPCQLLDTQVPQLLSQNPSCASAEGPAKGLRVSASAG